MKKNKVLILTPFYPIKHRKDLFEDTKAIFYLVKELSKHEEVLILHIFNHSFRESWKRIAEVFGKSGNYKDYLYKDEYNNNILFFENLFFIPKSIKSFWILINKYKNILKSYYIEENFYPKVLVVHFPTYYYNFLRGEELAQNSIAIIHSFDIKNIKKRKSKRFWIKYFKKYSSIGFRSYKIKEEFENYLNIKIESFMCLSGIPNKYISSSICNKGYNSLSEVRIVYAGRLDKNKNVEKVVYALKKIKEKKKINFTIIGEGNRKNYIENIINNNNMNDMVFLKGKLAREETFEYMQKSDIFIMISKKETLGLVYLEAMAAGCIVIGTRGQGIDGIIIDGINGFLTDCNNEVEITNTINHVINLDLKEQDKIRKRAKETVELLEDSKVSTEYYNNIRKLLRKGGGEL